MFSFGSKVILLVLIVAGVVAIVGDRIGRSIGRKRISFLKLRPRHTAIFFTVTTGMLIALCTISFLLFVSQDVRTALFGLEELQQEVKDKTSLLEKTKEELTARAEEKEKIDHQLQKSSLDLEKAQKEMTSLEEKIAKTRQGDLLFRVDEILLVSIIQAGPERDKLEAGLRHILSAADSYVREFGDTSEKHLIFVSPEDFQKAIDKLALSTKENIVRLIVGHNTLFGEAVPVRFDISENKLVYKKNEEIALLRIDGALPIPKIEQEVKRLLAISKQTARAAGVLPDTEGTIGTVSYAEIYALAKKIKKYDKVIELNTIANQDIYSLGPLTVEFKVYYL